MIENKNPEGTLEWLCGQMVEEDISDLLGVKIDTMRIWKKNHKGPTRKSNIDRLELLAKVAEELRHSYNLVGIGQWWNRPRTQLFGASPRNWNGPPVRLIELASEGRSMIAT